MPELLIVFLGDCVGSPGRRAIAKAVLATPGADRGPAALITAALLPERLRRDFGLAWNEEKECRYRGLAAQVRALRPTPVDAHGVDR